MKNCFFTILFFWFRTPSQDTTRRSDLPPPLPSLGWGRVSDFPCFHDLHRFERRVGYCIELCASVGLSGVLLVTGLVLGFLREVHRGKGPLHHITSRGTAIRKASHWWCSSWSRGPGGVFQGSPLLSHYPQPMGHTFIVLDFLHVLLEEYSVNY